MELLATLASGRISVTASMRPSRPKDQTRQGSEGRKEAEGEGSGRSLSRGLTDKVTLIRSLQSLSWHWWRVSDVEGCSIAFSGISWTALALEVYTPHHKDLGPSGGC